MMCRILLVDDSAMIRLMTREELAYLGHTVVEAHSGDDAWRLVEAGLDFDLLLTDIRMPGTIDGWELARRVRARNPDMRIIYVSGYSGEAHFPVDFSQMIKKPYRLKQLAEAVA